MKHQLEESHTILVPEGELIYNVVAIYIYDLCILIIKSSSLCISWPTIRYFNKETGKGGAPYEKKTDKAMCDELGDLDTMMEYIEEAAGTSLCALDGSGCDERSLNYLEKMKVKSKEDLEGQLKRLQGMEGNSMKRELKDWLKKRIKLLKTLVASHDEL